MSPDLVNGLFELGGAAVIASQIVVVLRDQRVEGVRWWMPFFFWCWTVWNIPYYASLGQWWSWAAAWLVVATHSVYAGLLWWFRRPAGPQDQQEDTPWGPPVHHNCRCTIRREALLDKCPGCGSTDTYGIRGFPRVRHCNGCDGDFWVEEK